jgi:hypothetical protein
MDPFYDGRGGNDYEGFRGRIPLIYNPRERQIWTGEPNWFHHDTIEHHGLTSSQSSRYNYDTAYHGYFNGGPEWGRGELRWYNTPPEPGAHENVVNALTQAGYQVNPQTQADDLENDDLWEDD